MAREKSYDQTGFYRIQVKGRLDPKWKDWFDYFEITYTDGETVLQGTVPDQAALFGVLAKINDLGLTLIAVRKLPQ